MRIKRFVAPDMRSALQMVREDQGPNAVILSNRRIDQGVEVVAATDYDEALVQQAMRAGAPASSQVLRAVQSAQATASAQAARAPVTTSAARTTTPSNKATATATVIPAAKTATATVATTAAPVIAPATPAMIAPLMAKVSDAATGVESSLGMNSIRKEITSMRELLERELGRFTDERLRGAPVRAAVLDELLGYGIEPDLARSLVATIPLNAAESPARGLVLAHLSKSLCVDTVEPIEEHGVIALVGPTGVGKTTTLAKLAARYATKHSARDVAIVTTDVHRPGAREQLFAYGRLMGMPVIEAGGDASLSSILDRLSDYRLVLIDTTGLGPRDKALEAQLAWLRAAKRIRSYLVLPANAQTADLEEVIQRFRPVAPVGVILSKLDETSQLGGALSLAVRHRIPLSYVTDGQRVPEDLHPVVAHRLVLRLGELKHASKRIHSGDENSNAVA